MTAATSLLDPGLARLPPLGRDDAEADPIAFGLTRDYLLSIGAIPAAS